MPASDDLRNGLAEAYDVLSSEFQSGVTVKLCKQTALTDTFTDLYTVADSRFFEYSNYRKELRLEIADNDSAITTAMLTATHVKIDSTVYEINAADTLAPAGTNPVWTIYATLFANRVGHYTNL